MTDAAAPSMLVNSERAPSSAFVLIVTYRLPGEHTPPPRQHVMYGDTAAGLALYLEATIHLYPVVGRIVLQPLEAPTDTTPRIAKE